MIENKKYEALINNILILKYKNHNNLHKIISFMNNSATYLRKITEHIQKASETIPEQIKSIDT